jgi:hypothetical protein
MQMSDNATGLMVGMLPDEDVRVISERLAAASAALWKVENDPQKLGENWWLFDCGTSADGKHYYVTTDDVPASQGYGDPSTDAEFIVWCRNDMAKIGRAYLMLRNVAEEMYTALEAAIEIIELDLSEGADRHELRSQMHAALTKARGEAFAPGVSALGAYRIDGGGQ